MSIAALALLAAAASAGCGADATTSPREAATDLQDVFGGSVHFRERSGDRVIGVVQEGSAVTDFAVVKRAAGFADSYRFDSGLSNLNAGCASVVIYSRLRHDSKAEVGIEVRIEDAVFHRGAPDAYCEG